MKWILLFIVAIGLCGNVDAQNNNWEVYLQGYTVKSIGFENDSVWALTDSFLVRLNKKDKSIMLYPLPENSEYEPFIFQHLKISDDGKKWICSGNLIPFLNGIYSFEKGEWKNFILPDDFLMLYSIETDKNNLLWLTSAGFAGAYLFKFDGVEYTKYSSSNSGLPYNFVQAVTADKNGDIWFGNTNWNSINGGDNPPTMALVKYDGEIWTSFPGPSAYYSKLVFDDVGYLWIQSYFNDQLIKWDLTENSWNTYLTLNEAYALEAIDVNNKFWFTYDDNGVAVYNASGWQFLTRTNSGLPSDTVYQIKIDSDETKWIATAKGLASYNVSTSIVQNSKSNTKFKLYPNPVHDQLQLEFATSGIERRISISDIHGRKLKCFNSSQIRDNISLRNFPGGMYLLIVETETGSYSEKFIKQ